MCSMGHDRHPSAGCQPRVVTLERQAKFFVVDPQVAVGAAGDGVGPDCLHVLGHDADVGLGVAVIDEAIEAEAVVEVAKQDDVVLEADVGAASGSATTAARAATTAARSTTAAAARTAAAEALCTAGGLNVGRAPG